LLAKGVANDAEVMPAHQALAAATLHGARALGLDDSIGSLAPGKFADMCALEFDSVELAPCYDPVSHLVYAAGREHVSHVWVAGEIRVEAGRLARLDKLDLDKRSLLWQNKLVVETKA
jgi:5-methylthioadenosine/S-adenosylhomocysteine deaminase